MLGGYAVDQLFIGYPIIKKACEEVLPNTQRSRFFPSKELFSQWLPAIVIASLVIVGLWIWLVHGEGVNQFQSSGDAASFAYHDFSFTTDESNETFQQSHGGSRLASVISDNAMGWV